MPIDIADKKFQAMLLSLMVTNKNFVPKCRVALKPEWFEYYEFNIIADSILGYYDKYKKVPDFEILKVWLSNYAPTQRLSSKEWCTVVDGLRVYNGAGLEFVYDKFMDFIQFRAYKDALYKGADLLKAKRWDAIPKVIREAQKWERQLDSHTDFFDNIFEFLNEKELRDTIPTGITDLDAALRGGTARGELTVVLAPASRGKTTMLVNMGTSAIKNGFRVYHFHAEQPTNIIRARYAACLLGVSVRELKSKPKLHSYKLSKFKDRYNDLYIQKTSGVTVDYLRSFIYRQGHPDIIILDYADKLVASQKYSERRHEIEAIYDELIRIADEFNCSVITASQTNEAAYRKAKISMESGAEARVAKAAIADTIIALNQTPQEKETNDMRLTLVKVRNEEGNQEIEVKVLFDQMRILSMSQYREIAGAL